MLPCLTLDVLQISALFKTVNVYTCILLLFRQSRLTAYRQFVCWMRKGEKLGKGNRAVIPSCAVLAIRNRFPEPNDNYTGFRSVVEDMRDLFR